MKKALPKKRIQFDFSEETFGRLESLKRGLGVSTYAELTRASYRVLEHLKEISDLPDDSNEVSLGLRHLARSTLKLALS